MARRRRSDLGLLIAGAVVIVAGFAVAIVEALHFPKGSIWLVVGGTVVIVTVIRLLTNR
jgi:hypothetical protein